MALSIKNKGDRIAENVAIQCDNAGFAEITTADNRSSFETFSQKLEIGGLGVEDAVAVNLWIDKPLSAERPIFVVHSFGKQEVSFPTKATGLLGWLARNKMAFWIFVSLSGCAFIAFALVVIGRAYRSTRPRKAFGE